MSWTPFVIPTCHLNKVKTRGDFDFKTSVEDIEMSDNKKLYYKLNHPQSSLNLS